MRFKDIVLVAGVGLASILNTGCALIPEAPHVFLKRPYVLDDPNCNVSEHQKEYNVFNVLKDGKFSLVDSELTKGCYHPIRNDRSRGSASMIFFDKKGMPMRRYSVPKPDFLDGSIEHYRIVVPHDPKANSVMFFDNGREEEKIRLNGFGKR